MFLASLQHLRIAWKSDNLEACVPGVPRLCSSFSSKVVVAEVQLTQPDNGGREGFQPARPARAKASDTSQPGKASSCRPSQAHSIFSNSRAQGGCGQPQVPGRWSPGQGSAAKAARELENSLILQAGGSE